MWASETEKQEHFNNSTHPFPYGDGEWVGERIGVCEDGDQHAIARFIDRDGNVLDEQRFVHAEAFDDMMYFIAAWREGQEYTMEERLGPYGLEWEREQHERGLHD